jgi:glycosyltransferase involved in cell wall biosynthesis
MRKSGGNKIGKVLYVDHTAEIGGGEIALLNLVRNLDLEQVTPIVLLLSNGPLVERMRPIAEIHVLELDSGVTKIAKDSLGWRSIFKLKSAWITALHVIKVSQFARRRGVGIIHTNSLKSDIIGGLAAKMAGIPVIWHVRDRIEPDYLPGAVVKVFRFLCRVLPDFVIANSTATLETLRLMGKREGEAIASGIDLSPVGNDVVHDGCEVEDSSPGRNIVLRSQGEIHIGLIGRISPWKGQHIFIESAALLRSLYPNARFHIIGAPLFAERDYEEQLHAMCGRLDLTDVIHFSGFVKDVPARIAQLDIVVHASTTGEPFGQVIIEGMAQQKPVVATNGGGVPEIVENGVTGMLVPMGDAPAMANAIQYLLENPKVARQMGIRGRERVIASFTIQTTARKVEAVYKQVLGLA